MKKSAKIASVIFASVVLLFVLIPIFFRVSRDRGPNSHYYYMNALREARSLAQSSSIYEQENIKIDQDGIISLDDLFKAFPFLDSDSPKLREMILKDEITYIPQRMPIKHGSVITIVRTGDYAAVIKADEPIPEEYLKK